MITNVFSSLTKVTPDTAGRPADWRDAAACRTADPELFFPRGEGAPNAAQIEGAKAVCSRCPVREECLAWAMKSGQLDGVWGGKTEKERANMRRKQARATAGAKTRKPLPAFATDREAYDTGARVVRGGHIKWVGGNEVKVAGARSTPNQVAWRVTRGTQPVGRVFTDCDYDGCVQHLTDQTLRDQRTAQRPKPSATPSECGTTGGYRAHRARGETACQPCKDANAQADWRLRNTGTSKIPATA